MNSGNPDSKGIIKEKTEGSVMQERIGFVDSDSRKQFFLAVREASSVPSWDALAKLFHVYRSQFQGYQYGKTLLPEKLFNSMLAFLPKEKQKTLKKSTKKFCFPRNCANSSGHSLEMVLFIVIKTGIF